MKTYHAHKRQNIRKGLTAAMMFLFPVTAFYFSPYLFIWGASKGILVASAFTFAVQMTASLVFGRAFCGWLCPAGAIQNVISGFRNRPVDRKRIGWIKFVIWGPWLLSFVLLLIRAGGVQSVDTLYHLDYGVSVSDLRSLLIYLVIVLGFFLSAMWIGQRGACHALCWMAPFMIIGRKVSLILRVPHLRLKANPSACVSCKLCDRSCSMGIEVEQLVKTDSLETQDCILCGACADSCPRKAIQFDFGKKLKTEEN